MKNNVSFLGNLKDDDIWMVFAFGSVCLIVLLLIIGAFGFDPLDYQSNHYRNITVVYDSVGDKGKTVDTKITLYNFLKDFEDKTESLFTDDDDIKEMRDSVTQEYIDINTVIYGHGIVKSLKKLDDNYEIEINMTSKFRDVKAILLRIPLGDNDNFIMSLDKGQKIEFEGEFDSFGKYSTMFNYKDFGSLILTKVEVE